jgi:TRAP-type mannitol/chloroaromatic compound transport system substrate-binding protein
MTGKRFCSHFIYALTICVFGLVFSTHAQEPNQGADPAAPSTTYGADQRHHQWEGKTWKPATRTFNWKLSHTWGHLILNKIPVHFADSVRAASAGKLDIEVIDTGKVAPAMGLFEAVREGKLDCGHSWPGYWKRINEAFVAFGSVPFGLDFEGYNVWYYARGGRELMNDLYGKFGLVAFFCGNPGQELGLNSNKPAKSMADFNGMIVRTPGWYQDIMTQLGATVMPIPGAEVYQALLNGVVEAAEFSTPAVNYPLGFHDITKYIIQPGVHQPSFQLDLFINKERWDQLPGYLQEIVKICAKETQLWTHAWAENLNIEAVKEIEKRSEFILMDDATIIEFAKTSHDFLNRLKADNPDVRLVLQSQEKFKEDSARWRELRGRVAPWPYETYIGGKLTQ